MHKQIYVSHTFALAAIVYCSTSTSFSAPFFSLHNHQLPGFKTVCRWPTCAHTRTSTYIHAYIHTYKQIHTYVRIYVRTYKYAHMHTYINTQVLEILELIGIITEKKKQRNKPTCHHLQLSIEHLINPNNLDLNYKD